MRTTLNLLLVMSFAWICGPSSGSTCTAGESSGSQPSRAAAASSRQVALVQNTQSQTRNSQKPKAQKKPTNLNVGGVKPKQGKGESTQVVKKSTEPAYLKNVPIIPREVLFGNPQRAAARISPDGKHLSYLAPVDGVLNVWVGSAEDPESAKPVTKDTKRGIRSYFWAYTNQDIVYLQDSDGDENWHVYRVNLESGETKDLTPIEKVAARVEGVSHRIPGEILVGVNDRNPQLHDIYRVNLASGEKELVEENKQGFSNYVVDEDFRVRFGMRFSPNGGIDILTKDEAAQDEKEQWKDFSKIAMEDSLTTSPAGFDKTGEILFLIDSRDRNTAALKAVNLKTGEEKLIAENELADIGGVLSHPTENTIEAVSFTYTRTEWQILDQGVAADLDYLKTVANGEIEITSRTLDDSTWTVAFLMDNGPVRYFLYDRKAKKAKFLFTNRQDLEQQPLVKMHPVVIDSRDGKKLVSYLSLPPGTDSDDDARPDMPLPLVLDVHGGPWARDEWGYNPFHQWLANRGYAVLSVNFRGSTGFGKDFLNAGNREWAGKMHDDLLDAVNWAVEQKIADKSKVAITGGSYGGYATLVGLTFTPDVFACGVDIVGPSNILTLLSTVPPYWQPVVQMFKDRVGDFQTDEGKEFLKERSPLSHVDKISRPLLIGQGANDPRVKQAESDQIVTAMRDKKIPVTYVLFPDEGHGFARPSNSMAFNAIVEAFLAVHLGGRSEPIGESFAGSTVTVPTGAEGIPGLAESLPKHDAGELAPPPGAEPAKEKSNPSKGKARAKDSKKK